MKKSLIVLIMGIGEEKKIFDIDKFIYFDLLFIFLPSSLK